MKLNVSYPATGAQKLFEIEDEKRVRFFLEKRMGQEVMADQIGEEWKGYVLRINGGNDRQGFPMKQGVLTTQRVRLLMSKGHSCYRVRRAGERKRKSVRGCIVDPGQISVLALSVVKKGDTDIAGLTDVNVPRRLGPKRASKIRKLFNLTKEDNVRDYVVKRKLPKKEGKPQKYTKPKIQRLVTPRVIQHKKRRMDLSKERKMKAIKAKGAYEKLLAVRYKELQDRKAESKRRKSSRRKSTSSV